MKKRLNKTMIIAFIILTVSGCSKDKSNSENVPQENNKIINETNDKTVDKTADETKDNISKETEKKSKAPEVELKELSMIEFDELLKELPMSITSTKYVIQDDEFKSLYPDLLQVILKNNTQEDIKNAVVAFVGWDENGLPVKIKGNIDFSDGQYIKLVNYNDINLVPGKTAGENSGFQLDEKNTIKSFKAAIVSYETFDGETWNNPFYDDWKNLYEGEKFSDDMSVKVSETETKKKQEISKDNSQNKSDESKDKVINTGDPKVSETYLIEQLESQDFKIIDTKYTVQDEKLKNLYPDLLQVILKNDTEHDIKDAVVAFVGWDDNKLPVKIKGNIDFSDGQYIKLVNYSDINLIPGGTFGEESGFQIDEKIKIKSFKAIVVSYETFDGTTWDNPLYEDWKLLYEGKKL